MAGIHADNGNSERKWDAIKKKLNGLKLQYKIPQIIYMDINTDIKEDKYKQWKKGMIRTG